MRSRQKVVDLVTSWIGLNERDGSHKKIIDIYNSYKGPLPRGTKMRYDWSWCACTWSALAIKLGYTDIMPIEISCIEIIKKAKAMGCWQEKDNYIPWPADAIIYDWQDNGIGDNIGSPDHIGTIIEVNRKAGYMVVTEGNYNNSVKKRIISINGKYIRGFITPKYDDSPVSISTKKPGKSIDTVAREVIAGSWGDDKSEIKKNLKDKGYDVDKVMAKVTEITNTPKKPKEGTKEVTTTCIARNKREKIAGTYVTTTNVYCRNDAGKNKKALCLIPKGTEVKCYGFYNTYGSENWYLIQFTLKGVKYTGFTVNSYLKRV